MSCVFIPGKISKSSSTSHTVSLSSGSYEKVWEVRENERRVNRLAVPLSM